MESKNAQRYASAYIEYILNMLLETVSNEEDKQFIKQLIANNNITKNIQNARRKEDNHPILGFNIYELLYYFRLLREEYVNQIQDEDYSKYILEQSGNKTRAYRDYGYSYRHVGYVFEYITPEGYDIRKLESEKNNIKAMRNADAHGDIDVLLADRIERYVPEICFYINRSQGVKVKINEDEFKKMLYYFLDRICDRSSLTEIFILNKEFKDELGDSISNEDELEEYLETVEMLFVEISSQDKTNTKEGSAIQAISRGLLATDNRDGRTARNIASALRGEQISIKGIKQFSDKDIKDIIEFTRRKPQFFKERPYIQKNLIREVVKKNYIEDKKLNNLVEILMRFEQSRYISYFAEKTKEYIDDSNIQKAFSMLSKIVFLSNKEKVFDGEVDYDKMDISGVNINFINEQSNAEFFRRLRNSITHYRYEFLNPENTDLNQIIHIWDENKEGECTFDGSVDFKSFLRIVLDLEFLKVISEKHQNERDYELVLEAEQKNDFLEKDLYKNPEQFQYFTEEERNNRRLIMAAVERKREALAYIGDDARQDRDFLLEIVKKYPDAIMYLKEYSADDEFAVEVLSRNGYMLEQLDDKYRKQEEYILIALETARDIRILYDIPSKILYEKEFIRKAILIEPRSIEITNAENRDDDELALLAVRGNGVVLESLSKRLRKDPIIALEAIISNRFARQYIDEILYDNPEFCKKLEELEKTQEGIITGDDMDVDLDNTQDIEMVDDVDKKIRQITKDIERKDGEEHG